MNIKDEQSVRTVVTFLSVCLEVLGAMGSRDTLYWAQNICTNMSLSTFAFVFSSAFVYLKYILIDYVSDEIDKFFLE